MADDWDESSSEEENLVQEKATAQSQAGKSSPPQIKKPSAPKKWEGEDKEEDGPVSDWEESSEEESEDEKPAPVAPPKKKGTLKQKLAEKEAAAAAAAAAKSNGNEDEEYDSDVVLDPREKAQRAKEIEVKSDLTNAADLFGAAALGGTSSSELDRLITFRPQKKEDFIEFSSEIIEFLIKPHESNPLYQSFIEHHARALALPLKDVEVRKVASGLTTLANEKQKEQREKASGKKKPKAVSKPVLGSSKVSSKLDTRVYEEALDDFGNNADDFM